MTEDGRTIWQAGGGERADAGNREQELLVRVDAPVAADAPMRHRVRRGSDPAARARLARAQACLLASRQKVPILIDGDVRIWESLAIVEHLAEKSPEKQLWPAGSKARAGAPSKPRENQGEVLL